MRKEIISALGSLCLGILFLTSCTKMDYHYKDYIVERNYIGKPDSIWANPGNQRVQIGILTPKDPAATKMVVRWNNNADSAEMSINQAVATNTMLISNLEERDYVFEAYTMDEQGNKSLIMEVGTPVYGPGFGSTMRERIFSHTVSFGDSLAVVWPSAALYPESFLGNEVEYTNVDGQQQTVFLDRTANVAMLHGIDSSIPASITSVYTPHEHAFEYFYTEELTADLQSAVRNSLTFGSTTYTDAIYVDFMFAQGYLDKDIPTPIGADIDMAYALGAGSRGNLFTMDGTGFSAFAAVWQTAINGWSVRNVARMKLNRGEAAVAMYDQLNGNNRSQMADAYQNSTATASTRLSSLALNDIVLLHSSDRNLYVAMKVVGTPPPVSGALGDFTIEFKVSRP